MGFSMEFGHFPTENQVRKILEVIGGNFAEIKKLWLIGWCASYMIDKRVHQKFMVELSYLNISPNRNRRQGDNTESIPFNLCYCLNCRSSMGNCLGQTKTSKCSIQDFPIY